MSRGYSDVMKILAIADRPPRTSLKEKVMKERPDLIVTLGGLDYFSLRDLQDISDIPKIGVYGNHCSGNYFEPLGIENMHLRPKEVGGKLFGGFQGSIRYKQDPSAIMYTDEEAADLLEDFPPVDIFLAHSPPRGIHDEDDPAHKGLEALREYVIRQSPTYFLHGHTYVSSSTRETPFGGSTVIHVYEDQILNLT